MWNVQPFSTSPASSSSWNINTDGTNVVVAFFALFTLSAALLGFWIFITLIQQSRRSGAGDFSAPSSSSPAAPASRLDPAAIQRLPITVIAAKTESASSSAAKECSVCISELRDGDRARALPPCGHTFHVECIDSWLLSRSTCPLCRNAVVVPSAPAPPPVSAAESTASTSADAGVDMTKAPPLPGPADVAICIDNDVQR